MSVFAFQIPYTHTHVPARWECQNISRFQRLLVPCFAAERTLMFTTQRAKGQSIKIINK